MKSTSMAMGLVLAAILTLGPLGGEAMAASCNDITEKGCCDGNILNFCASDFLFTENCLDSCGWNPITLYYECGSQGPEPTGTHPISCGCVPNCEGKSCGDDGCGGSCGTCPEGFSCSMGMCSDGAPPAQDSCVNACGTSAPDGSCWCDDTCEDNGDCCKDVCTACGICAECTPDCTNKECGDNGCGGQCGVCPDNEMCTGGICIGTTPLGPSCEGFCDGPGGDGSCWCDEQCVQNGDCCQDVCEECGICNNDICQPDCGGKQCGDNGCGEPCGLCSRGETCENGLCKEKESTCTPDCSHKECGDDGCGGSCGSCQVGEVCDTDSNFWTCASAEGQNPDGGGSAEGGSEGVTCSPDCTNKLCGDDGCGGLCGVCPANFTCSPGGTCAPPSEETTGGGDDLQAIDPDEVAAGAGGPPIIQVEEGGCQHGQSPAPMLLMGLFFLALCRGRSKAAQ